MTIPAHTRASIAQFSGALLLYEYLQEWLMLTSAGYQDRLIGTLLNRPVVPYLLAMHRSINSIFPCCALSFLINVVQASLA